MGNPGSGVRRSRPAAPLRAASRLAAALLAAAWWIEAAGAPLLLAQSSNLLNNGSFENGYYHQDGIPELAVPLNWRVYYVDNGTFQGILPGAVAYRPETVVWNKAQAKQFFDLILSHAMQGYYGDPRHGGNREAAGWRMLGIPATQVRGRDQYDLTKPGVPVRFDRSGR